MNCNYSPPIHTLLFKINTSYTAMRLRFTKIGKCCRRITRIYWNSNLYATYSLLNENLFRSNENKREGYQINSISEAFGHLIDPKGRGRKKAQCLRHTLVARPNYNHNLSGVIYFWWDLFTQNNNFSFKFRFNN